MVLLWNYSFISFYFDGDLNSSEVFLQVLNKTETTPRDSKESKWIDSIQKIIYDRIAAFEKDPEIRRKFMATAYEADITDLVKPYMEKARKEGELKGELKSKLETARKMMEFGDTLEKIILITGLSEAQLKKNGLL